MSMHKHKCEKCGTVWEHDRDKIKSDSCGNAHECPNCGQEQWEKYYGDDISKFKHDGTKTRRIEPLKAKSKWSGE